MFKTKVPATTSTTTSFGPENIVNQFLRTRGQKVSRKTNSEKLWLKVLTYYHVFHIFLNTSSLTDIIVRES